MSTPTGAGGDQPPEPEYGAQSTPSGSDAGAQSYPAAQGYGGQGYGAQGYGAQGYPGYAAQQPPRNGFGIAALVLGIIGLVLSITIIVFWLGAILCILAIIFGILGLQRAKRGEATNRGMAIGGLTTGIIGLVIAIVIVILGFVGISILSNNPTVQQLQQCQQQAGSDQAAQRRCGEQFGREFGR